MARRKPKLPPYGWRVGLPRLFTKHGGGPWIERAYVVDHDERTTTVAGCLRANEVSMAVDLAMADIGLHRVTFPTILCPPMLVTDPPPKGWIKFNGCHLVKPVTP